jgi:hypothetical protein
MQSILRETSSCLKLCCIIFAAILPIQVYAVHPSCLALGKLLNAHDPSKVFADKIVISDITKLSNTGVYKVPLSFGGFGVLRLDYEDPWTNSRSNIHDVIFEDFSTRCSGLLGVSLPTPMRVHPPAKLMKLLVEKEKQDKFPMDKIVNALQRGQLKGATILPFYPGVTGKDYLQSSVGMNFRSKLSWLANHSHDTFYDYNRLFKELTEEWASVGANARVTLLEDIRKIFPNDIFTEARLMTEIDTKLRGSNSKPLRELVNMAFERIPYEAQVDLAQSWAVFTILGIPDFNPQNWLIHEGHITPIDLANRSAQFTESGSDIFFQWQQNFLDGNEVSPEFVQKVRRLLPPAFIAKIKSLTIAEIMKVASDTRFTISIPQAEAMLKRAHRMYD